MINLKQAEKNIKAALRSGDANFAMAYNKMHFHYAFVDFANQTNHCKIISMLYNSRHKYSIKFIAFQSHVSDSTLLRYREQYVICFNFYLNHCDNELYGETAFT